MKTTEFNKIDICCRRAVGTWNVGSVNDNANEKNTLAVTTVNVKLVAKLQSMVLIAMDVGDKKWANEGTMKHPFIFIFLR